MLAKKTISDLLTIIIPRHINRIDDIYKKLKNLGLNIQIRRKKKILIILQMLFWLTITVQ